MQPRGKRIFSNATSSDIFFAKKEAKKKMSHQPNIKKLTTIQRRNLGENSSVPRLNKTAILNDESLFVITMNNPLKEIDKIEVKKILNKRGINLTNIKEKDSNGILPNNGRNKITFTAVGIDQGYNRHFTQAKYDLEQKGIQLSEIRSNYNKVVSDIIPAKTTYQDVPIYSKLIRTKSPYNCIWNDRSGLVNKVSKANAY